MWPKLMIVANLWDYFGERSVRKWLWCIVGVATVTGCDAPTDVSGARRYLGERAGQHQTAFSLPLMMDTFQLRDLLTDARVDTTGALLGLTLDPETVSVDLGSRLQFDAIGFDAFEYDFNEILATESVSIATPTLTVAPPVGGAPGALNAAGGVVFAAAGAGDTARFTTPNGSTVTSASIASGYVVVAVTSSFNVSAAVTVTIRDASGSASSIGPLVVPLSPPGVSTVTVDSSSLAGATISGFATIGLSVVPLAIGGGIPAGSVSAVATFRSLRMGSVTLSSVNEQFTSTYDGFAGEPRLTAVDTVVARSGTFALTVRNRLPVTLSFSTTLAGTTGPGGAPLTANVTVPAAAGDGTQTSGVIAFDLAGATIRPSAVVATVTATAVAGNAVITQASVAQAVSVSGTGSIEVERLAGSLNPLTTPELRVALEEVSEVDRAGFDFGELEDALTALTFNDVAATVRIVNTSGTPVRLVGTSLRLVRLAADGQPVRDGSGNLDFERDSLGGVLAAALVTPGQSSLVIPRATAGAPGVATANLQMGPIVTKIVRLLFGTPSVRVGVVAVGEAEAGDGLPSGITRSDSIRVAIGLKAQLDLSLPDTGIVFERADTLDGAQNPAGAGLKASDSADVVRTLDSASLSLTVQNGAPFRVVVYPAFIGGEVAQVFGAAGAVELDSLVMPAAQVNPDGTGGAATTGTLALRLTGTQLGALLGQRVTFGVKVRLLPGLGTTRAALRPGDTILVSSRARIAVTTGGGGAP